ncbi:MAG: hypothetical protein R3B70_12365 [Polyangiaceae bacterium]
MQSSTDYKGCIELMCKMENDPKVYAAFQEAMTSGPDDFAAWLSTNGIPADIAKKIANSSGTELFQIAGEVVCKRFW